MVSLGRTGSDTITHIVSMFTLLMLGIGGPALIVYFQHAALDDVSIIAIVGFWTACSLMMAYYSVAYQQSPTGTIITTKAPDGTTTTTEKPSA